MVRPGVPWVSCGAKRLGRDRKETATKLLSGPGHHMRGGPFRKKPRSAQGQLPHGARLPPQPLMPLLNGSLSRVVVSSQDPRWTWTSHHPFDAPRRCAVERGRAYVSESEGMLLSEAEIRAILQRGVSKKRPAIVGSTMHWPIGGVPGRESCETLSPNQSGLQSCTTARTRT